MISTKKMVVLDPQEETVPLTFTRASVAYDYKGDVVPINTPRFTHLINGNIEYGILIEEAHTNLLTADASQEILHATPYTTGTLNGTYTFQCEGTGSYVLSGGATGTVSKDNPITAAVVSATVTLTPAVSSTLNQILKTAYPLSWTLGGTTQAAETLTAPSSVLNIDTTGGTPNTGTGTIEVETYINSALRPATSTKRLFQIQTATQILGVYYENTSSKWRLSTTTKTTNITDTLTVNTFNKFGVKWDVNTAEFLINGVVGTKGTISSPDLIYESGATLTFLNRGLGDRCANTIIRNITVSTTKRTDTDITARTSRPGFGKDRMVTLHAPLQHDLKAVRVRR